MDEREEYERLKREFGGQNEREEYENLKKEFAGRFPEPKPTWEQQAAQKAWSTIGAPIAAASHVVDRFVGAPIRAGLNTLFDPMQGTPIEAAASQFGEDPRRAPTYGQLASKAGFSDKAEIPFPGIKNFGTPQSRFYQTKVSPADIAGGALGVVADPINYIPGAPIVKTAEKVANVGVNQAEKAAMRFGKYSAGVPEDALNYYKKNWNRLRDMEYQKPEKLRDDMLSEAEKIRKDHDMLIKESQRLQNEIEKGILDFQNIVKEGSVPDIEEVKTIQRLFENDKLVQKELSQQADEALAELNITARRRDLEKMIDDQIKGILPVGEGATAVAALEKLRNQTSAAFSDYVNGPQLRDWMQQVRKIPQWDLPPGQYNTELDKSIKQISGRLSEMLKKSGSDGSNPTRYEKLMNEMSAKIKASENLADYFINDARGLSTLQKLTSIKNPALTNLLDGLIREYAKVNEYPQLINFADDAAKKRDIQSKVQESNYRYLAPELFQAKDDLDTVINLNEPNLQSINRITPASTENIIRDIGMAHGGKYVNQEQVEALERLSGVPFEEQIRDTGNLREFTLDRTRGSKRTTPGTIVGGMSGGLIGALSGDPLTAAAAGAATGFAGKKYGEFMDVEGGRVARTLLDRSQELKLSKERFFEKFQNPTSKFKKYADVIQKLSNSAKVPTSMALMYHQILYNNDPEYRRALAE